MAGACAALWLAVPAYAEEGSLVVVNEDGQSAYYHAYRLFCADVSPDDEITHVSWPSDEMADAVLTYLDEEGYPAWLEHEHPGDDQHDIAQNAAEYVSLMIADSPEDAGANTTPPSTEGGSFATGLARHIASNPELPYEIVEAGHEFVANEGYWLVVSSPDELDGTDSAGSSPIWSPLGGSLPVVVEKSAMPSFAKELRTEATGTWGHTGDAFRGQQVSYHLSATLPENLDSYEHYHLLLTDTFSTGIALSITQETPLQSIVAVSINGKACLPDSENLSLNYNAGVLTVEFANLRDSHWDDYELGGSSVVTVDYQARLVDGALVGAAGNTNGASMVFSNDPTSEQEGVIEAVPTKVFCYALKLQKVSESDSKPLSGASFTIRLAQADGSVGEKAPYLQADGSLGQLPCEFSTGKDGCVLIEGVGTGTYVVTETKAPEGFQKTADPITFMVSSELNDQEQALVRLSASVKSDSARISSVTANEGTVTLSIRNKQADTQESTSNGTSGKSGVEKLAQTGVGPIAGVLVCAGLVLLGISQMFGARKSPRRYRR